MAKVEKYLKRIIGADVKLKPLRNKPSLPLYISEGFKFFCADILEKEVIVLQPQNDDDFTPDQLQKISIVVGNAANKIVIYLFKTMLSYNRQRMMQRRLNFIVVDKVVFIPSLLIDVQPMAKVEYKKAEMLTPLAQLMVLYHLLRQSLEGLTVRQLSERFNATYITASRAFRSMKELALCEETYDKEQKLHFTCKGRQLWENAKRVMSTPVLKTIPLDEEIRGEGVYVSNINAMAEYTMLNDDRKHYYAMKEVTYKKLFKTKATDDGENVIESFRYDPAYLTDNSIIDPLSLYLEMRDNSDDRIQIELEQLIDNIKWLEE